METAPLGAARPVLDIKSVRNIASVFGAVAVRFHVVNARLLNPGRLSEDLNQEYKSVTLKSLCAFDGLTFPLIFMQAKRKAQVGVKDSRELPC